MSSNASYWHLMKQQCYYLKNMMPWLEKQEIKTQKKTSINLNKTWSMRHDHSKSNSKSNCCSHSKFELKHWACPLYWIKAKLKKKREGGNGGAHYNFLIKIKFKNQTQNQTEGKMPLTWISLLSLPVPIQFLLFPQKKTKAANRSCERGKERGKGEWRNGEKGKGGS